MDNSKHMYNNQYWPPNQPYPFYSNGQYNAYEEQLMRQQPPLCHCNGNELLCLSIPSPITAVLLGNKLQVELPCIRITSEKDLTPVVEQLLTSLSQALGGLSGRDPNEEKMSREPD
ncbi:MAG TPA: hypothetical protein VFK33_11555 [Bacillales bacterium]|nr:hypothetical protein [Bacillales bacterium]